MRVVALVGLLATLTAWLGCAPSPEATPSDADVAAIEALLYEQQAAWNRGDLDGFMAGYWQSDSLRFASGGAVRQGWQATLEAYQRGYPDVAAMGRLTFDSLDVRPLGPDDAYVFGHWALARDTSFAPASGLFTLILRRQPEGWRVVHDHTSSAR